MVANKIDLEDKREITRQMMIDLSRSYKVPFFETSAKTGENIEATFHQIVREIVSFREKLSKTQPETQKKKKNCFVF